MAERKNSSKPRPPLEAAVAARTKQFKQTAREAKLAKYRNFRADCRTETTVTQLWQLYQQMQGSGCAQITPDLKDTNGTRPANRRSGLAWAIPATEHQNDFDDRKHTLSDHNSTLAQNGPNEANRMGGIQLRS